MQNQINTSWDQAAEWYDQYLESGKGTYQSDLILPNILRIIEPKQGMAILDLACGQGFFSREFARAGAEVYAVDSSKALIDIARTRNTEFGIKYSVSESHKLPFIRAKSIDVVVSVLALQNIEYVRETMTECFRVLKINGSLVVVLNHPSFRIPKASSWGWDEELGVQYRRIDQYLSDTKEKIYTNPGEAGSAKFTYSFHHPLQWYMKHFINSGFMISRLEEWISGKKSEPGPRARSEDRARKEIPMFLLLQATKIV